MNRGLQVASWLENLPPDDLPPEEIWHHSAELKLHFERIKAKREQKPAPNGEEWESVPGAQTVEFDNSEELRELRGF